MNIGTPDRSMGEYKNYSAFSAIKIDGSVVSWGSSFNGGDNSTVATQLDGSIDVVEVFSAFTAFAALREDGSVITWGRNTDGGDSSSVTTELNGGVNVKQIFSTALAFAALREDGSVITWGDPSKGGNSSTVEIELNKCIKQVFSTFGAFAALKTDGSVVTWGDSAMGGNSSTVATQLDGSINVKQIYSSSKAFSALRVDGSVVTWGESSHGGDSSTVVAQLINVEEIYSTNTAFAALKTDGTVVTWGNSSDGGDNSAVTNQLTNVEQIFSTWGAFAALKTDGTVVTWGDGNYQGGNSSLVASQLTNVEQIFSTNQAFAALKADGSVVAWGGGAWNGNWVNSGNTGSGNINTVASQLNGSIKVEQIFSTNGAFAALREDGSVIIWGDQGNGGSSSGVYGGNQVAAQLDGTIKVTHIYTTSSAFAALREDGSLVTWGHPSDGGNSNAVASDLISGVVDVSDINTSVSNNINHNCDCDPVISDPVISDPVISDPVISDPVISDPVISDPVISDPVISDPVISDPVISDPVVSDPIVIPVETNNNNFIKNERNILFTSTADDTLNGGAGLDSVIYNETKANYTINKTVTGFQITSNTEGTDTLTNVERLKFADKMLALDIESNAGQAYRIYQAALNRTPDEEGLGYWISQVDNGVNLNKLADSFINSSEFTSLYGTNPTDETFVTLLYDNVLHRIPNAEGNSYWVDYLQTHTKEDILISFSESAENKANLASQISNGIEYQAYDHILISSENNKALTGQAGNDTFIGSITNDNFDGGDGRDTAIYTHNKSNYTINKTATGFSINSSLDGTDSLTSIERLQFNDTHIALDINGNAGQAYRLYQAAFNRSPDKKGLGYWIDSLDKDHNLENAAEGFINSQEFISLYGKTPTNNDFVSHLYDNVLHRELDTEGANFWINSLQSQSKTDVLIGFSESKENQLQVIGDIQHGIEYTEWIS